MFNMSPTKDSGICLKKFYKVVIDDKGICLKKIYKIIVDDDVFSTETGLERVGFVGSIR